MLRSAGQEKQPCSVSKKKTTFRKKTFEPHGLGNIVLETSPAARSGSPIGGATAIMPPLQRRVVQQANKKKFKRELRTQTTMRGHIGLAYEMARRCPVQGCNRVTGVLLKWGLEQGDRIAQHLRSSDKQLGTVGHSREA